MPVLPNSLEKLVFADLNLGPGPFFDLWSGLALQTVLAALHLDLFESLQAGPASSGQVAARLKADERGVQILLNTLEQLGYLRRSGESFENTALTSKWMLDSGEINLKPYFLFWGAILERFMPSLAESIRSGKNIHLYEWLENQPEVSRNFQEGMIALARYGLSGVIRALKLSPQARRLLDVGGGHAMYSVALCQKYPHLQATIFDSQQAMVTGRKAVEQANLAGRVHFQTGNFFSDDLGSDYDATLLFNIVHGLSPEENISLFRKVRQTLRRGGEIIILDQVQNSSKRSLPNTAVHLLSMSFYHLLGGQVYPPAEVRDWLGQTGFTNIRQRNLPAVGSTLFLANGAS